MSSSPKNLDALTGFVDATKAATNTDEITARSQVFAPTGYPQKLQVADGIVFCKPDKFDYAPDIDVAARKIKTLNALARNGKLAVLNISIEPGSGKTLFLPFKFTDSVSLVVLPTVFDAWSAHTTNQAPSNISVFGFSSSHKSNVTYTDSYHAAFLITTGEISKYQMVFVDESHSQEGVTLFMASVARPGQVYVRMTASPPTTNARPKKSFPIMEERDVPSIHDSESAAAYVSARQEHRVLVLTPSPKEAGELAARVPQAQTLTMLSPPEQILSLMSEQAKSALIIADFVCGKGINLNADCVVDFFTVATPAGARNITKPEQLQRKARVGRSKPGTYCCAQTATASSVVDNYSVFRANLWFQLNGIQLLPCSFPQAPDRALAKLLASATEPALLLDSIDTASLPSVTPVIDDTAGSDSGDTVSTQSESEPVEPHIINYSDLILDDQPDVPERDDTDLNTPSWVAYYISNHNHPTTYVADLIYEHRGISASAVLVNNGLVLQKATNRKMVVAPSGPPPEYSLTRALPGTMASAGSSGNGWSVPRPSRTRRLSGLGVTTESSRGVKYGSAGFDVSAYSDVNLVAPVAGSPVDRRVAPRSPVDIPFDGVHMGGPLAILRGTKYSNRSRGVGYKAVSVCGGYLTVAGVVLASGKDMHTGLTSLPVDSRMAIRETTTASRAVNADYYLSWVVTKPLDVIDVQTELVTIKASGAWSIPPNNVVPTIDLEREYSPMWVTVVTDRIRNKMPLPPITPRGGFYARSRRGRVQSGDVLDAALAACDYPTYSHEEQQVVYRAWNILAVTSGVVGPPPSGLYNDAQSLFVYMSSADRLADL